MYVRALFTIFLIEWLVLFFQFFLFRWSRRPQVDRFLHSRSRLSKTNFRTVCFFLQMTICYQMNFLMIRHPNGTLRSVGNPVDRCVISRLRIWRLRWWRKRVGQEKKKREEYEEGKQNTSQRRRIWKKR